MLTKTHFQAACTTHAPQEKPSFKKGNTVIIDGVQKFVMARLQEDSENPVTYSICDTDLRNPKSGLTLESAVIVDPKVLSEDIRRRSQYFV